MLIINVHETNQNEHWDQHIAEEITAENMSCLVEISVEWMELRSVVRTQSEVTAVGHA